MLTWRDWYTVFWYGRDSGGGSAESGQYAGTFVSSPPYSRAQGESLEATDLLDVADPNRMRYQLNVETDGVDGMIWEFAQVAEVCFSFE